MTAVTANPADARTPVKHDQDYDPAVPVDRLTEHPENPRRGDVAAIEASLDAHGFYGAVIAQRSSGRIIAGNHRYRAAVARGAETVPVIWLDVDDDQARRILLVDNRTSDLGGYDDDTLADLLTDLTHTDLGLAGTGWTEADLVDLLAEEPPRPPDNPSLADRFIIPPISVLDARSGPWQERKRRWLSLGIRSELGRRHNAAISTTSGHVPDYYTQKSRAEKIAGRPLTRAEFEAGWLRIPEDAGFFTTGTSVFDPVLCELAYRWFSPADARVLDPFAGGSVRGVVAAALGRPYTGVELRGVQVQANQDQWTEIEPHLTAAGDVPAPTWIQGDSTRLADYLPDGEPFDLVFSCPPYADLEVYSDDPADLSNMPYDRFLDAYRGVIRQAVDRLAPNRFAVWVVGEVRDKRSGAYRGFVADTIRAFQDAGADYHSEMILVTPIGALPTKAGRQFTASRRIAKSHQQVLVFVKGDPKAATEACGPVEVEFPVDDTDVDGG